MPPAYPVDTNPFADPYHGKPGRRPKDHLPHALDEIVNQRYDARTFVVPLDMIDKVRRDAGNWGFEMVDWHWLANQKLMVMAFSKRKAPLPWPS